MSVALALLAMLIELCAGYPQAVLRAIGHPVNWIGGLIAALDRLLNRGGARRGSGIIAVLILISIVGSIALVVERELFRVPFGLVITAIIASTLIAQRSLHQYVANVAIALETGGVAAGRTAVSHIVGRDTAALDEAGVARAAIESLAENFSDGVVAPVFWTAIAGLPGAALYKAINTADSMIGHRTERYAAFGWAAARLDDLVNLPASRLSALLLIARRRCTRTRPRSRRGAPCGSTRRAIVRPMPAIRKRQWRERLACRSQVHASMAACALAMPRWAAGAGTPMPPISASRLRFTAAPMRS